MSPKKKERKDPAYMREQGHRQAIGKKPRQISFSLSKIITTQGQTIEEWDKLGLLKELFLRVKFVGQYSTQEAIQKEYIKQYTKVDFPPNSEFTTPVHLTNITWAVMHLTTNSIEVVAGYFEDDIFYIIFLDKDHKFWPLSK